MKPKILLVHNKYLYPGGEDVVFDQERGLLEGAGHEVVTYYRSNQELEQMSPVGQLLQIKRTIWAGHTRQEFLALLRRERPQLVHVHNTFLMISPSIYSACHEANVPVVQMLHNYRLSCPATNFFRDGRACEECADHSLWRGIQHACYRESHLATAAMALMLGVHRQLGTWTRKIDAYIAASEFSRKKFLAAGLPPEKVYVKPNFCEVDSEPAPKRADHVLFVGRLSPEKGVGTLLSAWQQLHHSIPLHILGDGPIRAELEAKAASLGLKSVLFLGHRPRAEATAAIKSARFLVVPSECYENFPVTIAEAFACGAAVICSRLGAMEEIVTDGHTGLHFVANDSMDLASRIEWAWTHAEQMQSMGKAARVEYEAKFTPEQNYSMLMDIYQRAIASRREAARKQTFLPVVAPE